MHRQGALKIGMPLGLGCRDGHPDEMRWDGHANEVTHRDGYLEALAGRPNEACTWIVVGLFKQQGS